MKQPETIRQALEEIFSIPVIRLTVANPRPGAQWKKLCLRPIQVREQDLFQMEKFTSTQVFHENLSPEQVPARLEDLLAHYGQLDGVCQGAIFCLKISKKGKLFFSRQEAKQLPGLSAGHNRQKQYLLSEGVVVPPLVDLGVLTPEGRVVKAKYDKFKQINRFLEFLDDLLAKDPHETLRIVDFGCGKSYLTFVIYYYITQILHRKADITGLDLKADVIAHCNQVAAKYGYTGLRFFCGDIRDYRAEIPPDMVITLHACDTATDYALYHAMEWGARYILSAPCCQHELNLSTTSAALPPVTGYGILKERFSALATDAIRAKLLESRGYEVQVLEFIDLIHSPKNLLIRAKKANPSPEKRADALKDAQTLLGALGGRQTLLTLLGKKPVPAGCIRLSRPKDFEEIMALYDIGRAYMRKTGNAAQWTNGYPYPSMIQEDIRLGRSYVLEAEGRLQAVFALIWGEDPTYQKIEGAWLQDQAPYGAIHRIASRGELPGAGARCIQWCLNLCGDIRMDTHKDNSPMRRLLERLGFSYCGEIICDDGTPRRAYQKVME